MFPIQNTVPTRYPPVVTWSLIAVNCVVFLFQVGLGPSDLEHFLSDFALTPARYFEPFAGADATSPVDYLPFLTNTFLHAGWLHLILNMWTLWLFGPTVEDRLEHWQYLAFYLACGVIAGIAQLTSDPHSMVPALGASGAIAGIMGCYVLLFPWARIVILVPILFLPLFFEVPSIVFIGLWFLAQLLQGVTELFGSSVGGGVAVWAHVGGFLAGLGFGILLTRPKPGYRPYYADEGILGFNPQGYR